MRHGRPLFPQPMSLSPLTVGDFEAEAQRRLPRFLFDYAQGGANSEQTMRRNISDLASVTLRQRVLRNVKKIDLSSTVFGQSHSMPIGLGPVGIAGLYRRRGECQAATAARRHGVPFTLSTVSLCSLDEVIEQVGDPCWFQLYVLRDRGFMADLMSSAAARGCDVLVFTVDMPVPGARYRDARSGMAGRYAAQKRILQAMTHPQWAWDVGIRGRPHKLGNLAPVLGMATGLSDYMGWLAQNFDPRITWSDLEWVRRAWPGKLIIKGILDEGDARAAVNLGADGVVVSNHGGRQLDGVQSTVTALPAIVDAVGGQTTVLVDGGIRSGIDVVRMLALGANMVLLGRAWIYALAARGEAGVTSLLEMMEAEVRIAMALTGVTSMKEIGPEVLAR